MYQHSNRFVKALRGQTLRIDSNRTDMEIILRVSLTNAQVC